MLVKIKEILKKVLNVYFILPFLSIVTLLILYSYFFIEYKKKEAKCNFSNYYSKVNKELHSYIYLLKLSVDIFSNNYEYLKTLNLEKEILFKEVQDDYKRVVDRYLNIYKIVNSIYYQNVKDYVSCETFDIYYDNLTKELQNYYFQIINKKIDIDKEILN